MKLSAILAASFLAIAASALPTGEQGLSARALPQETPKQTDKRAKTQGANTVAQLQSTFDRNNPNGTPANGSPADLNGDGVINFFEAGAQAD